MGDDVFFSFLSKNSPAFLPFLNIPLPFGGGGGLGVEMEEGMVQMVLASEQPAYCS